MAKQDQYAIDAETSVERMLEEAAYEQTETDLRISAYRTKGKQHAVSYENAYARFEAILRNPKLDSKDSCSERTRRTRRGSS